MLVCDEDTILSVHLPPTLQRQEPGGDRRGLSAQVEHLERELITEALRQTRGNQSQAAQILDTSLRILGYKIKQYASKPGASGRPNGPGLSIEMCLAASLPRHNRIMLKGGPGPPFLFLYNFFLGGGGIGAALLL